MRLGLWLLLVAAVAPLTLEARRTRTSKDLQARTRTRTAKDLALRRTRNSKYAEDWAQLERTHWHRARPRNHANKRTR